MSERSDPALGAIAVTPSDTVDIPKGSRALYIGIAGDVEVHPKGSTTAVIFVAAPVGILPVSVDRVLDANTTADSIVALF